MEIHTHTHLGVLVFIPESKKTSERDNWDACFKYDPQNTLKKYSIPLLHF